MILDRIKTRLAQRTLLGQALTQIPGTRQVSRIPGHQVPWALRCQKKLRRRIMGVVKMKQGQTCPTCRTPTCVVLLREDKIQQGKQAQTRRVLTCVPCGTTFYGQTVLFPPRWRR